MVYIDYQKYLNNVIKSVSVQLKQNTICLTNDSRCPRGII